ncbi:MAG: ribonuclease D [Thiomicrospira sp.]|uniref:ribonuclease D n=1 Tax=Thiomicrospira sp. TaxID=935 RepID=UPI0019DB20FC|nr:ribonuclease D [Thiomicrospira sp.]MBE0494595.1 ribonuclease D [Thiomicrospira sp.]
MNHQTIISDSALDEFCKQLSHQAWFAIDTEFVRQDTYYAELSLIQIYSEQGDLALIDPLVLQDMTPLWALLASPSITKVFHSARQDIEILFQVGGLMPQNIFDTQIAGVFLGYGDMAGFARVIENELNVSLDKDQTRTNWHQRPLTDRQIQYALDDVRFLAPLYQAMQQQLSANQKQALNWDFEQLLEASLYQINPDQAWLKLKGTQNFSPKQLGMTKVLAAWRERTAIELNQPRKWIINDEAILSLAKRPVRVLEGLYKVPELNSGLVRQFGEAIIQQLDWAFEHEEVWPDKPTKPEPAQPQEESQIQLAMSYAHQVALNAGLNLNNLTQRRDILNLLRQQPNMLDQGWRTLLLGEPLKKLFNHQACLCVEADQIKLVAL